MSTLFRDQPPAFSMIFMLEIWERFGFYTMQGILTLYFIRFLGFDDVQAYYSYGAFFALVYAMVAVGGYLGDKILGCKRTIVLGLITMAAGYLFLALANKANVFLALGLIAVGNGLFKANPSNLLSKCYTKEDPRLHQGFTLYYMAINLGSIAALFAGPMLSSRFGYGYAYFLSFIGMLLGLANYWFQRALVATVDSPADTIPVPLWLWNLIILSIILATNAAAYCLQHYEVAEQLVLLITTTVFLVYCFHMRFENKNTRIRMVLALVLMVEAVVFFTLYQQMATSINLFAVHNVKSDLFGIAIDPQSFQVLNPLWIISLSPLLALIYKQLNAKGIGFSLAYKFALGMTCCAISFLILFLTRYFADQQGVVSSAWLVLSYFFQSMGELLVSALGVAMVAELVPSSITGFVMGLWFLTSSIAGFIGAYVASFTALPKEIESGFVSLMVYTKAFAYIGLTTLAISLLLWLMAPYLTYLMRKTAKATSPTELA